jgi:hypothetical protein
LFAQVIRHAASCKPVKGHTENIQA